MELKQGIETRRSIRSYTEQAVTAEQIEEIVKAAQLAPSWKNSQTARYYAILDPALKERIAAEGTMQFSKNMQNIRSAAALVVLASVEGIAGYNPDGGFTTALGTHWQSFDAGIACQTFCLAAHDLGLGTLIMGIFDPEKVAELAGLPEGQHVAALIAVGYPAVHPDAPARKPLSDVLVIR
ncbi:MAG: nitroreductase family protein [Oscillospiraceae bacterium]|nr:nitroreductase family protein [Oscillospiraceae bacterium]